MILLDGIPDPASTLDYVNTGGVAGLLFTLLIAYFKYSGDKKDNDQKYAVDKALLEKRVNDLEADNEAMVTKMKEDMIHQSNSRKAFKEEMKHDYDEKIQVVHGRVDKMRLDYSESHKAIETKVDKMREEFHNEIKSLNRESAMNTEKILKAISDAKK